LLVRLSRSDAWWGHLSRFGVGQIDYTALTKLAKTRGERTEADFYEGVRRIGAGDLAGARTLLQKVMDSMMVGFYEFQMAQELLLLDDAQLRRKRIQQPVPVPVAAPKVPVSPSAAVLTR
jgi:lipoprotein NlpI